MSRRNDPHSVYGCDPETGDPREPLPPVPDADVTAARAAATARRYRVPGERAAADAYDSAPPRGTPLTWTRVYRRYGRYAHLRRPASPGSVACTGADAWTDGWLGTGSQEEYEKAASLPLCPRCFAVREAARPREGYDPADPGQ